MGRAAVSHTTPGWPQALDLPVPLGQREGFERVRFLQNDGGRGGPGWNKNKRFGAVLCFKLFFSKNVFFMFPPPGGLPGGVRRPGSGGAGGGQCASGVYGSTRLM